MCGYNFINVSHCESPVAPVGPETPVAPVVPVAPLAPEEPRRKYSQHYGIQQVVQLSAQPLNMPV